MAAAHALAKEIRRASIHKVDSLAAITSHALPQAGRGPLERGNQVAWALSLALLWFCAFRQLEHGWRSNPSYAFGYAVPWMAAYIAGRRMRTRRFDLEASSAERAEPARFLLTLVGFMMAWLSFGLAELLLSQILPPSRLPGWLLCFAATLLTGVWLWRSGGIRLLCALAFPIAFIWVAAPWPSLIEDLITLKLKTLATGITAVALNVTGFFAFQKGNVLELTHCSLGVNTACSGITSLQSSLMAALFLGEFFGLILLRRVLLVVAASFIALSANCARIYALAVIAEMRGESALERYHDPLGNAETVLILILIFVAARRMATPRDIKNSGLGNEKDALRSFLVKAGSFGQGYVALLAFAAVPLLAAAWNLVHGGPLNQVERPQWLIARDVTPPWHITPKTLSSSERQILGFTEGEAFSIGRLSGRDATLYHFFWKSGEPVIMPYNHSPNVCMVMSGWTQCGAPINVSLQVRDATFGARLFRFERDGHEVAAFETVWLEGEVANELTRFGMIGKSVRGHGVEVLEMFMPVMLDQTSQIQEAEETLAAVLKVNPRAPRQAMESKSSGAKGFGLMMNVDAPRQGAPPAFAQTKAGD
jgi:exosortase